MSGQDWKGSFLENLVLNDSAKGGVTAGSGLKEGDEIVAATIHLDHLSKEDALKVLKALEPYDDNLKVVTKQDLKASVGLGSLGADLKDPSEMLNSSYNQWKGLSMDASADAPVLALDGLNGKLNAAEGLGGEISGPTLNGELPNLTLNTPSADHGAKFTMPTIGMTAPNIKGADLDGTLRAPDASVSFPQLSTPDALLKIEKPELKTSALKYKPPKFNMPNFNLPHMKAKPPTGEMDVSAALDAPTVSGNLMTPDLKLSAPKMDIKTSDVDLNGPNLDLENLDVDLESPSGKIKWPHLKLKSPKIKGPDVDLNADLSAPDVNLSTPKLHGELSTPNADYNLPNAGFKGPDVDVQDIDIDASGKINWPHLKWKKPKLHWPKADMDIDADLNTPGVDLNVPGIEGQINAPDVDLNAPKADLEGPDLDVQTPNIDVDAPSGKINWPHLKWKKPKLHGPQVDGDIDADLNTPNINLSTPKIEGKINTPDAELNLPKADLKGPDVDVQVPDVDLDAPLGKVNWPHLKWKKPKFHGPKADVDIDGDLKTPNVDLLVPKIQGELNAPNADLNLPKADIDVKAPDVAPLGKIKFPTLKRPKFQLPGTKIKAPDVDLEADLNAPDLNLSPPEVGASLDGPDVGLNVDHPGLDLNATNIDMEPPSGKLKWPTLKKPKWSLSTPNIDGEIGTADVNLPKADLEGPKVDLDADVNIEAPSGKFKWLTLKKPKFGTLKGPKADVDVDLKTPDLNLKGPDVDLSASDLNLSAPKIESGIDTPELDIRLPNADIKGPDVNLDAPDVNPDPLSGKLKLPKFKLPKIKGPKIKGPNVDADLKTSDIDASVDLTKVDVGAPNMDIKTPNLSLSTPNIEGGIDTPDLGNLGSPKADLKGPDVAPSGNFKLPKIRLPKFGLTGPRVKGSNLDVDTDLKTPELEIPDVKLPGADLTAPDVDLKAPDLNLASPQIEGDIAVPKIPKFEMPKFNIAEPKIQVPDVNLDVKTPEVSVPNVEVSSPTPDVKAPAVKLNSPDLNLSATTIKGDLLTPKIESDLFADPKAPDAKLNMPELNLSTPKVEAVASTSVQDICLPKAELKGPNVDLHAPNADLDTSEKFKLPKIDWPTFGLSKPKLEGPNLGLNTQNIDPSVPDVDGSFTIPDLNLSSSNIEGDLSAPDVNGKFPTAKEEVPDIALKTQGLNLCAPDIKYVSAPDMDTTTTKADLNRPVMQLKTQAPDIDAPKMPHFKIPKLNLSSPQVKGPSVDIDTPNLNVHPSLETGIEVPKVNVDAPKADANISEVEVKAPNVDMDVETSKLPHFKLPEFGLSGPKLKVPEVDDLNVSPDVTVIAPNVGEISSSDISVSAPEVEASLNKPELVIKAEGDEVKDSKSKQRWPFKWMSKSSSNTDEEGNDVDSETDLSDVEVPIFKFHKLPRNSIDDVDGFSDSIGIPQIDRSHKTEVKDYIISKGIRLPKVNVTSNTGEKVDVLERLKMAKEKTPPVNIAQAEAKGDVSLQRELAAPRLDVSASTKSVDSTLVRGETFKVGKPESGLDLEHPVVASSEENDKLSLSLSNMLGLNIKDEDDA